MRPNSLEKSHGVGAIGALADRQKWRREYGDMVVDKVMDEVEREQLRTHVLRLQILLLVVAEDLMAQFAESSQHQKGILDVDLVFVIIRRPISVFSVFRPSA